MSNAARYYDRMSERYTQERDKGFLGLLVRRERRAIAAMLEVRPGETVLDAGCGSGDYSQLILELGGIPFGVDISAEMIRIYKARGFQGSQADLASLELNTKFSAILCAGPLEFVPAVGQAVASLTRHLEPGGRMLCLLPRRNIMGALYWLYHRLNGLNIHLFSRRSIARLAQANDLCISRSSRPDWLTVLIEFRRQ